MADTTPTNYGYVPPPPPVEPKRGRSPWFYVGIGCLSLFVITLGGCFILFNQVSNQVKQDMDRPLTAAEVNAPLQQAGVPVYPGATLNLTATKAMRSAGNIGSSVAGLFGQKISIKMAAFTTPKSSEEILKWYDIQLKEKGWVPSTGTANPGTSASRRNITGQRQYRKDTTQLVIQTQREAQATQEVLLISLIDGIPNPQ